MFKTEKALIAAARHQKAKAFLAVILGTGAALVVDRIPIPAAQRLHNQLVRQGNQLQLQHTYQIRHISQLKDIDFRKLFARHHEHLESAKIVKPHQTQKIGICDPSKPYPKDGGQGCLILADVLEEHCNPDFKPGLKNQHRKLTWPGEGDPMGPDPTRIQAWKNCDHVRDFEKTLAGQLSPDQIKQAANDALGDVNPKLNVDNTGKVMPLINEDGRIGQSNPPFDTYNTSEPQVTITPRSAIGPKPSPLVPAPAITPR